MRIRKGVEEAIFAAVYASRWREGHAQDNSDAESAIDDAKWAVECYRQALREQRERDREEKS